MDSNMKGGTEFDGSDLFADKEPEPDWKLIALTYRTDAFTYKMLSSDLIRQNGKLAFQRDVWSVLAFTIGLLLGWFSWWVL